MGSTFHVESTSKAFYVGIHRYQFRPGEPAEILGVKMVTPKADSGRPCFHVRYTDGAESYVVMDDEDKVGRGRFYKIISEEEVKAGKIPAVVY